MLECPGLSVPCASSPGPSRPPGGVYPGTEKGAVSIPGGGRMNASSSLNPGAGWSHPPRAAGRILPAAAFA